MMKITAFIMTDMRARTERTPLKCGFVLGHLLSIGICAFLLGCKPPASEDNRDEKAKTFNEAGQEQVSRQKSIVSPPFTDSELDTLYSIADMTLVDLTQSGLAGLATRDERELLLVDSDSGSQSYMDLCTGTSLRVYNQACSGRSVSGIVRLALSSLANRRLLLEVDDKQLDIHEPTKAQLDELLIGDVLRVSGQLLEARPGHVPKIQIEKWERIPRGETSSEQALWRTSRIVELCRQHYFSTETSIKEPLFRRPSIIREAAIASDGTFGGVVTLQDERVRLRCLVENGAVKSAHSRMASSRSDPTTKWELAKRAPGWDISLDELTMLICETEMQDSEHPNAPRMPQRWRISIWPHQKEFTMDLSGQEQLAEERKYKITRLTKERLEGRNSKDIEVRLHLTDRRLEARSAKYPTIAMIGGCKKW